MLSRALALLSLAAMATLALPAQDAWAQSESRALIAVLEFDSVGATTTEAFTVTDRLREALLKTERFRLLDRTRTSAILREKASEQANCADTACTGRLLGVSAVVIGTLVKIAGTPPGSDVVSWQVSARIVDVASGETVRSESMQHTGDLFELLNGPVPLLAKTLAQADLPASAATPGLAQADAPVEIAEDNGPGGFELFGGLFVHSVTGNSPSLSAGYDGTASGIVLGIGYEIPLDSRVSLVPFFSLAGGSVDHCQECGLDFDLLGVQLRYRWEDVYLGGYVAWYAQYRYVDKGANFTDTADGDGTAAGPIVGMDFSNGVFVQGQYDFASAEIRVSPSISASEKFTSTSRGLQALVGYRW
jgi:hypothetical protein